MDFELEMAFFVGGPSTNLGEPIKINEAQDHIFGFVIMNDWSGQYTVENIRSQNPHEQKHYFSQGHPKVGIRSPGTFHGEKLGHHHIAVGRDDARPGPFQGRQLPARSAPVPVPTTRRQLQLRHQLTSGYHS